ncbi:chaperonin 10-like protein [Aspergillus floccosus]
MRAVRFHGRGDIRIDQIDEPTCAAGQVKIRPAFVGICGSDLHEYLSGPITIPQTPHAITGQKLPVTLGHEFSGTVEEVGAGVTRVRVGDRVAIKPNLADGTCPCCVRGRPNCCRNLGFIGYSSNAGGLSDHVVVPEKHAIPLPGSMPLDIGALVEPLTVAWHAVNRAPIETAQTALVVGGGPIGLAVVQVLKARGVDRIVVAEVSQQRQRFATTLGATDVVDPRTEDVVATVRAMTAGAGADVAFECSGVQAGFDTAMNGIRVRGTVTIVSLWEEKPVIDAFDVVSYEKHVVGAAICDEGDFEAVIEAIAAGKISPQAMITGKIRMEDVVEKGFEALVRERDQHVKILIDILA